MRLINRVAVVTGAASGIGQEIARTFTCTPSSKALDGWVESGVIIPARKARQRQ